MLLKSEIISICCSCGKVREEDTWKEDPQMVLENKDNLSHGICPECTRKLYPSLAYVIAK